MNMDEKRSRSKRKSMNAEEGYWDCSVCTFRNPPEAFKCEMCDVRKGTSTRSGRKPRINPAVVMQQVGQQVFTPPLKKDKKDGVKKPDGALKKDGEVSSVAPKEASTSKENSPKASANKKTRAPRLKNIDRSSGQSMEVTVGNVTVVITDYQPKKASESTKPPQSSSSSASSLSPSSSTASVNNTSSSSLSPSKPQNTASATSEDKPTPSKTETVVNGTAAKRDES